MPESDVPLSAPRRLPDPWAQNGAIVLDGPLETVQHPPPQARFWRLFQAFAVLAVAFVLFQAISSVVAVLWMLVQGVPRDRLLVELTTNLGEHARALMVGNTAGQVLGLALPAWLIARLHTSRQSDFLRFRPGDAALLGLAVLGLVALTPLVQWLGALNSTLPVPDWVKVLEQSQMQLIEQVLGAGSGLVFNLVVLAVTPAFCEELLFRGYVQRQAERGLGVVGGILVSGIVFGLYHLRLTQVLPLSLLGIYLAYLVWRTGSLWPAIVVHFANNAFAVSMEAYLSARPGMEDIDVEQLDIPWYLVVAGTAAFVVVVAALQRRARLLVSAPAAARPEHRPLPYE